MESGEPSFQCFDDIDNGSSPRRCHHSDFLWQYGQLFLPCGVEKPLLLQLLFELLKSELQSAFAFGFEELDDELIFSSGFINIYPPARHDLKAVLQFERNPLRIGTEHDRAELAHLVLQCEIQMPGMMTVEIGDLALYPEKRKRILQLCFHQPCDFGDCVDFIRLGKAFNRHFLPQR